MDAQDLERRYAEARDALLIEFGSRWIARKPYLMTVHRALMLTVLIAGGYDPTRVLALAGLYATGFAIEIYEARRVRRGPCSEHGIAAGTALGMLFIAVGCVLTGGYASPLIPSVIAPVIIPAAAFGRRRPTWFLLGELLVLLAIIVALPRSITGPALPDAWLGIGIGASIVFAVWMSVVNLVTISEIYTRAAVSAARMREEALEQHEARARRLETMGAKVAHELKNPLAAIAGLAQLLLQGQHDDKTRERLGVMASEITRMEKVLRGYLAFSRPLEDVRPMDADLAMLADDVVALLEGRARSRGVVLERRGERLRARVDPARLKEALLNLVDNAIEASPGGSRVIIELVRVPGSTSVRVRDHGEGISAEHLARVGTPYFTTRAEGTGLGVVIARAAIEQHGGTLALHSRPGEGTLAEIVLPDPPPLEGAPCDPTSSARAA